MRANKDLDCQYCGGNMSEVDEDIYICDTCNAVLDSGTWSDPEGHDARHVKAKPADPLERYAASLEVLTRPDTISLLEIVVEKAELPESLKASALKSMRATRRKLLKVRNREERIRMTGRLKRSLLARLEQGG